MTKGLPKCDYLSLDQRSFHLTITFDRPEARNAMNVAMAQELGAVFEAASGHPEISASPRSPLSWPWRQRGH